MDILFYIFLTIITGMVTAWVFIHNYNNALNDVIIDEKREYDLIGDAFYIPVWVPCFNYTEEELKTLGKDKVEEDVIV